MISDRIWVIANKFTGEIVYCSNQYSLSKKVLDHLRQLSNNTSDCKAPFHKLYRGEQSDFVLDLFRYDLSRHYWSFGRCFREALVETPFNPLASEMK